MDGSGRERRSVGPTHLKRVWAVPQGRVVALRRPRAGPGRNPLCGAHASGKRVAPLHAPLVVAAQRPYLLGFSRGGLRVEQVQAALGGEGLGGVREFAYQPLQKCARCSCVVAMAQLPGRD